MKNLQETAESIELGRISRDLISKKIEFAYNIGPEDCFRYLTVSCKQVEIVVNEKLSYEIYSLKDSQKLETFKNYKKLMKYLNLL